MLKVIAIWEKGRIPGRTRVVGVKLGDGGEDWFRGSCLIDIIKV